MQGTDKLNTITNIVFVLTDFRNQPSGMQTIQEGRL